jgi:tripartite-type tricarboxylate transporter receptor subunit TctC
MGIRCSWPTVGNTFQAMLIRAAVMKEIRDLLHREIVKVLKLPDVKARLEGLGLDVVANTQERSWVG